MLRCRPGAGTDSRCGGVTFGNRRDPSARARATCRECQVSGEVERRPIAHGDGCACTRCVGFEPGNTLGRRHGAYSRLALAARAAEHAAAIRELVPAMGDGDEYAVAGLAMIAARVERVSEALDRLDGDDPLAQYRDDVGEKLRQDARAWLRVGLRYCEALGLTPATRARLGLTLAEAQAAHRDALDLDRLSDDEVRTLRALVAKAEGRS